MKKIILVLFIFTYNVFAKEFTIVNNTNLKIQPFLAPVKMTSAGNHNSFTTPGYIKDGQIVYINPYKSITIELKPEIRDQLTLDFSTAQNFYLKAIQKLDNAGNFFIDLNSDSIEIKDKALYVVSLDKIAADKLSVEMYLKDKDINVKIEHNQALPTVNSASSISTLVTMASTDEEQKTEDRELLSNSFLK
ncbi:MAG: hypothetical protein P4L22_03185 [Candidatus Babeliales bacterium]|nr:hypothetical protein [Candidatus Babeliales bacterium]